MKQYNFSFDTPNCFKTIKLSFVKNFIKQDKRNINNFQKRKKKFKSYQKGQNNLFNFLGNINFQNREKNNQLISKIKKVRIF